MKISRSGAVHISVLDRVQWSCGIHKFSSYGNLMTLSFNELNFKLRRFGP